MEKIIKLALLSCFWCFLFNAAQAQNQNKIDSLINVLKTLNEDTVKMETLTSLSWAFLNSGDLIKAKQYAEEEIKLSEKLISSTSDKKYLAILKKGLGKAYNIIGTVNAQQGKYEEALKNYQVALKIAEEAGDTLGLSNTSVNIGVVHKFQGNYTEALKNYLAALKTKKEIRDSIGMGNVSMNIGSIYIHLGNYPDALKNYLYAKVIYEKIDYKTGIAGTCLNIGSVYDYQNNHNESLKYYSEALSRFKDLGNKRGIAIAYGNIGSNYANQGNYEEALTNQQAALQLKMELGDNAAISDEYNNIGDTYRSLGNNAMALKNLFASLKLREEIGNKSGIAGCHNFIGLLYVDEEKYQLAIDHFKKCLSLAMEIGEKDFVKNSYEGLSNAYEKMNDYKNAMKYHKLYSNMKDSLLNETNSTQINEMKTKYETEKKEKEIVSLSRNNAIQELEIKKQTLLKNSFIGGLALMLVLSFFVYNNFRIANKLKLQNIRNRIASDLHDDVGSTLNSISVYSEVAKQKAPAAVDELEHIGDASRKIIEVMSDIVWTINPKNDTFENIILRMSTLAYNLLKAKNMEHTFRSDESLNETKLSLESRRNFYLIFKEALNNLVKYSKATRASITLTNENGLIKLAIRDNGIGFDVAQTSKGNGLLNMKSRAEEMNAQLKIESEKGSGTYVELILKA